MATDKEAFIDDDTF